MWRQVLEFSKFVVAKSFKLRAAVVAALGEPANGAPGAVKCLKVILMVERMRIPISTSSEASARASLENGALRSVN
jgi:hypothetical protein